MANTGGTCTVYHYTNLKGKEGIQRTGIIEPNNSSGQKVVYFTTLPPTAGKIAVSMNNWLTGRDGRCEKADYAVEIEVPRYKLNDQIKSTGRNILTYDGPVYISSYKYQWRTLQA